MPDAVQPQSAVDSDGLSIRKVTGLTSLVLRLPAADEAGRAAAAAALALDLPAEPNRATEAGSRTAYWTAPGEWLVTGSAEETAVALMRIETALADRTHLAAALHDGRVAYDVEGPQAPVWLSKGTSLDLHPRAFGAGACAQTLFAQLSALVHNRGTETAPSFRLIIDRSVERHFLAWGLEAAGDLTAP